MTPVSARRQPEANYRGDILQKGLISSDRFVRFGSTTPPQGVERPVPPTPKPFDSNQIEARLFPVFLALDGEPGGEAIEKYLNEWKKTDYNDRTLITTLFDYLDETFRCNEAPIETIRKALSSGLQDLVDEALEREFRDDHPRTLFVQLNNISFFHLGRSGSARFLPVLESYLKAGTADQKEGVWGALTYLEQGWHPDAASGAKALMNRYQSWRDNQDLQSFETGQFGLYSAIPTLVKLGHERAVSALTDYWDKMTRNRQGIINQAAALSQTLNALSQATDPDQRRSLEEQIQQHVARFNESGVYDQTDSQNTRPVTDWAAKGAALLNGAQVRLAETPREFRPVIQGLVGLVAKGAPGILQAIEARRESLLSVLDESIDNPYKYDHGGLNQDQLNRAALFGETLDELPVLVDFETAQSYTNIDVRLLGDFPLALTAMEKRAVPGAAARKAEVQAMLDRFVVKNLLKPLVPTADPVNEPKRFSDSQYGWYLELAVQSGSQAVIPALERVLREPWAPLDPKWSHNLWSRSGEWYLTDKTELVRRQMLPRIEATLEALRDRLGLSGESA
jgi:hypothetical protein